MFSLWAMVRHVRQWFSHSVAVEMVVNGVLRTLWVMPYRCVSMGYTLHGLTQVECLHSTACFSTQY